MLIDTHIHVGQFNNQYFSAAYVSKLMSDVGVDYYAVSSTSMCEEDYPKVLDELNQLIGIDGNKVLPVMWITPEGLKGNIAWFLESNIKWRCVKVHPELNPNDWEPMGEQFAEIMDIATEMHLPILIHTGNKECCYCRRYKKLIEQHSNNTFILAHGRPIEDTISILSTFHNAFVDTAFMPIEDIKKLIDLELSNSILWGTDMCIPQYFFPKENMVEYYNRKLANLKNICSVEQFEAITFRNATNVFNIKV